MLVVGIHRSGASALTRVLNLAGCDLPKSLKIAGEGPEPGQWESRAIADFNDALLDSAGLSWHDWEPINPDWIRSSTADEFRERALELLEQEFGRSRLFVLKDPRICLLLEFWLDVLQTGGIEPALLMSTRNPLEVGQSLYTRDALDPEHGHLLWLRYMLDAEVASRGRVRAYASYDDLLISWPSVFGRVRKQLGLALPRVSVRFAEDVASFLGERHRHFNHRSNDVSENPALSSWLRDAYGVFSRWSVANEQHTDYATLDRVREELDKATPAFVRLVTRGHTSGQTISAQQAKIAMLADERNALAAQLSHERTELAGAQLRRAAETEGLRAEILALRNSEAENIATLSRLARAREALNSELIATRGLLTETLTATQAQGEVEVQRMREQMRGLEDLLDERQYALTGLADERNALTVQLTLERNELADAHGRHVAEAERLRKEAQALMKAKSETEETLSGLGNDLRASMSELSETRALVTQIRAQSEAEVLALRQQVNGLELLLDERQHALATLAGERNALIVQLTLERNELADAHGRHVAEAERLRGEAQALMKAKSETEETLSGLGNDLRASMSELSETRALVTQIRAQSEAEVLALRQQVNGLELLLDERQHALATLAGERSALIVQLSLERAGLADAQGRHAAEAERLRGEAQALIQAKSETEETLSRLQSELEAAQSDISAGRRAFREAESRSASLSQQLRGEIQIGQLALEESREELARLLAQRGDDARRLQQLSAESRLVHDRLIEANLESERLHHALETFRAEAALSQQALSATEERLLQAESALDDRDATITELRNLEAVSRIAAEEALQSLADERRRLMEAEARSIARAERAEQALEASTSAVQARERLLCHLRGCAAEARAQAEWMRQVGATLLAGGRSPRGLFAQMLPTFVVRNWAKARLKERGLFDSEAYLEANPDLKHTTAEPLRHYVHHGLKEGRQRDLIRRHTAASATSNKPSTITVPPVHVPDEQKAGAAPSINESGVDIIATPTLPPNDRNYWIPQSLRDYLIDTGREPSLLQITAMMDLVVAYGTSPDGIEKAPEFDMLITWLRAASQKRETCEAPDVSIVIAAWNNLAYTLTSVATILGNASSYTYEIIVADDCSTDGTSATIQAIGGVVKHIRTPENLSFLKNCNYAARYAAGKYIVMLNNDTLTLSGWLDHLIRPMAESEKVGFVGSKLLNSDGTLQEAGGVYWKDGSAWNYGRNQDPRKPEFNYVKDVDYVSGASIAMPTQLWHKLGGFDTHYAPAYCEDSDIAFRVREIGLRTIINPLSELIHHEGVSHGRDTNVGVKAYQVVNSRKFLDRWDDVLKRDHFPNGQQVFLARDRSRRKPHILFVDHYVPQWDRDAGSKSMLDCVRYFVTAGFHVSFWPDNLMKDEPYTQVLQEMGVEVLYGSHCVGQFDTWWADNGSNFDCALLSRCHIALKYIETLRQYTPECQVFYYGHDIPWQRVLQEYSVTGFAEKSDEAIRLKEMEDAICSLVDVIIYPNSDECTYARENFPEAKDVVLMPLFAYGETQLAAAEANIRGIGGSAYQLLFVGGFSHSPNGDAVRWFLNEVFPQVLNEEPRCEFWIVGSNMPDDLKSLRLPGVHPKGWMSSEDLDALTKRAACTVVPLRFGAGVKGKVISSFAQGSPVVSTSIGMQGIPDPDSVAFVGDSARDLAAAIVQCLRDRELAVQKATKALDLVRHCYSAEAMERAFGRVVMEAKERVSQR